MLLLILLLLAPIALSQGLESGKRDRFISLGAFLLASSVLYRWDWPGRGRRRESFRGAELHEVGTLVRIHDSATNPLAGHTGTIIAISSDDPYGSYLVSFENGLRFRYEASEFITGDRTQRLRRTESC